MKQIILLVAVVSLASCGLSEKEKTALLQAQKAREDSIRTADIPRLKDVQAQRSALSDSLASYNALLTRQQKGLIQLRSAIYNANDELVQIKKFRSGRTPDEQETQVHNQEMKIQSLLVKQITLQSEMEHNQSEIAQIKAQLVTASR